ncbi:hypothetical protein NOR_08275 [Metarhizium rileyi]|uniref:Glycosyltransferase family 31 protein n=1 Tax=Metarhizium rileyi (strain RCEF 4871) TaxID=1649241 RepID=A0A166WIC7_METRR|nr:hypothetical protein NOR_08275 [Metarhizium rileyi RCEF 4871]
MGVAVKPFKVSLRRRTPTVILACVVLTLLLFLLCLGTLERSEFRLQYGLPLGLEDALPDKIRAPKACRSDVDYLRRSTYNLTRQVVYQKRCLRGVRNATTSRDVTASEARPLIEAGRQDILELNHACHGAAPADAPCDTIDVQVPPPFPRRDYSEFLFGVASSSDRLMRSVPQFRHWLGSTEARLLAIVTDDNFSARQMSKLTAYYNKAGIRFIGARPANASVGVNEQHFLAVRELIRHVDANTDTDTNTNTRWGVIIDDDTFFPSLYPVARALDELDTSVPVYAGGLSENSHAVQFHGHMAYGGAGVFLSLPLMRLLEPNMEACLEGSPVREGDGMLKYCVDKTDTNLTQIPGLHQLDMGSDLSGFYESGSLPLSLHHWKTWHQAPVDKMFEVSRFCGGCALQRWRFGPDTLLANGYSIVVYKAGLEHIPLHRMEATWRGDGLDWEWSLGPTREKMAQGDKKSYYLLDAEVVGSSNLRQVYVHRPDVVSSAAETREPTRDEVIELWWEFA